MGRDWGLRGYGSAKVRFEVGDETVEVVGVDEKGELVMVNGRLTWWSTQAASGQ